MTTLITGDPASPAAVLCVNVQSPKQVVDGVYLHVLRTDGPAWPTWRRTMGAASRALVASVTEDMS